MALPKLPQLPEKVKPRHNYVLVFFEPIVPKMKSTIKLSPKQKADMQADAEQEAYQKILQKGSMRRAIVLALPDSLDTTKFKFQVNDVAGIPFGTYDTINIDGHPCHMVGQYDITVLPDLTQEEADKWDIDQQQYLDDVVYPKKDTTVLPFNKKEGDKLDSPGIIMESK